MSIIKKWCREIYYWWTGYVLLNGIKYNLNNIDDYLEYMFLCKNLKNSRLEIKSNPEINSKLSTSYTRKSTTLGTHTKVIKNENGDIVKTITYQNYNKKPKE